jgi:hypothetical protein
MEPCLAHSRSWFFPIVRCYLWFSRNQLERIRQFLRTQLGYCKKALASPHPIIIADDNHWLHKPFPAVLPKSIIQNRSSMLIHTLTAMRNLEASDPLGHVFSCLKMVNGGLPHRLEVDYREDTAQIFTSTAQLVIRNAGNLRILRRRRMMKRMTKTHSITLIAFLGSILPSFLSLMKIRSSGFVHRRSKEMITTMPVAWQG